MLVTGLNKMGIRYDSSDSVSAADLLLPTTILEFK